MYPHPTAVSRALRSRVLSRRAALQRLAGGGLAALGLLGMSRSRLAAQGASPVASPAAGGMTPCGDPKAGQAVAFVSTEGTTLGELTITQVVTPFEGYVPSAPPPRGNHFVLLVLSVKNSGSQPLSIDAGRVLLQDVDGFATYPTGIDRGDKASPPDFPSGTVAPGATATGAIGFAMLNDVKVARAFFSPSSDRLLLLADLR